MKTIFITVAYNSEKTIQRTIESILAQSCQDFIYYIVDNGSTDRTGEIIRRYAQIDSRIIVISKSENNIWLFFEILPDILEKHDKTDYLCSIDADDTYNYDFLEKMLSFIEKEHLDIAVCGNDFINSVTKRIIGVRKLGNELILEGGGFEEFFPKYYQFMRTVWGKIYSLSVLVGDKFEPRYEMGYGGDTVFSIEAFRRASRVGILTESLHKYYISPKSASYQFSVKRIISDRILFDVAYDFLKSKVGNVSKQNEDFLLSVYFYAIVDTLNVLLNAQINVWDKLTDLFDILQSQHTQKLIKWTCMVEEKSQLFSQVATWVLSQKEVCSGTGLEAAADILVSMRVYPSKIDGWQDCWVFMLLTKIKNRLTEMGISCNADAQILSITSKSPLLVGLNAGFLIFFSEIVFSIMQHDVKKALRQAKGTIAQESDIPDEYVEDFLTLGLNLSAKLENAEDYIYFKKLQILLLIDFSKINEAKDELSEWEQILPEDMDFKELRMRLMQ